MPKAEHPHKALAAALTHAAARDADVAAIRAALAALDGVQPPDRAALDAAHARVEQAAASLHLGDGSRADLDAASAALDQVRADIDRAAKEFETVDATRAGLRRRLQAAQSAAQEARTAANQARETALLLKRDSAERDYIHAANEAVLAAARVRAADHLLALLNGDRYRTGTEIPPLPPIGPLSAAEHAKHAPGTHIDRRITPLPDMAAMRAAIEAELAGPA